ncbi:MAG: hypothetical protein Q8872_01240 [Candidatus Phytoplasma australasiaticum]|nr:hypothetical protein [Candidatus Phytoplasma australasiaticum]
MNKLDEIKEITIHLIISIVGVVVIYTSLYFSQKSLYNEIHQKFTEVWGKCERVNQKIDEDRKENNREFTEIRRKLVKLKIILHKTQAKLTDKLDELANPSNQTETKNPASKQE